MGHAPGEFSGMSGRGARHPARFPHDQTLLIALSRVIMTRIMPPKESPNKSKNPAVLVATITAVAAIIAALIQAHPWSATSGPAKPAEETPKSVTAISRPQKI